MMNNHIITLILSLLMSGASQAIDRLKLEGTDIRGNKELPNVLYIVPWKPAKHIIMKPIAPQSVLQQPLKPINRNQFKQLVIDYNKLYPAQKATVKSTEK